MTKSREPHRMPTLGTIESLVVTGTLGLLACGANGGSSPSPGGGDTSVSASGGASGIGGASGNTAAYSGNEGVREPAAGRGAASGGAGPSGAGAIAGPGTGGTAAGGDPLIAGATSQAAGGEGAVASGGGSQGMGGSGRPAGGGDQPTTGGARSGGGGPMGTGGGGVPGAGGSEHAFIGGSGPVGGGGGVALSGSGGSVGDDGGMGSFAGGNANTLGGSGGSAGTDAPGGGAGGASGGGESASGGRGGSLTDSSDLCDVGLWDGSTPQPLALSGSIGTHDPTMIEADGVFYRFWTGDYILSATSTDLKNWANAPAVYAHGYPSWVNDWLAGIPGQQFGFPWAPDVSYFNRQYHIYSAFSAVFGDNISCVSHLTTEDIAAGTWTDHGPVVCTEGDENYNAIDPDVGVDETGNPFLAFGSFWDGIMLIPLNADGTRAGSEMTRIAWAREIEAPALFRRCGYYYLFVSWGLCCPGSGRSIDDLSYRVVVGRATEIRGPYYDRDGIAMTDGGGTLLVEGDGDNWAAAGHSDVMVSGDKVYHLYHAYRRSDGSAQLRIVELPFDDEGWPVAGGP